MMEDIEGTVHLDCSGGSGDIHISDVEDLTISDHKADGNNDLNIENCGSVELRRLELSNCGLSIDSGSVKIRNNILNDRSLMIRAWAGNITIYNTTYNETTINVVDPDKLIAINNTFLNSTLCLDYPVDYDMYITRNSFLGLNSTLYINMPNSYESIQDIRDRNINTNVFESCKYGITLYAGIHPHFMYYKIWDNYFGNCTAAIKTEGWCRSYDNDIWRNMFYHNGGTGDQGTGKQVDMTIRYHHPDNWYKDGIGNCWWHHRSPDQNNDLIVDHHLDIQADMIGPNPPPPVYDEYPFVGDFNNIFSPGIQIIYPQTGSLQNNDVNVQWSTWWTRFNITTVELIVPKDAGKLPYIDEEDEKGSLFFLFIILFLVILISIGIGVLFYIGKRRSSEEIKGTEKRPEDNFFISMKAAPDHKTILRSAPRQQTLSPPMQRRNLPPIKPMQSGENDPTETAESGRFPEK
ncbi:MAG: hypothetical protein U9R75_01240 [Candidatus Thermoplasmatota archaeon]|nr:hypothetical protein [Candidatus Thermoplasmatota archaeon]